MVNRYQVIFSAITIVEIESTDKQTAVMKARHTLDPDIDWDVDSIEEIADEEAH